jgi:hypothetical protein
VLKGISVKVMQFVWFRTLGQRNSERIGVSILHGKLALIETVPAAMAQRSIC